MGKTLSPICLSIIGALGSNCDRKRNVEKVYVDKQGKDNVLRIFNRELANNPYSMIFDDDDDDQESFQKNYVQKRSRLNVG